MNRLLPLFFALLLTLLPTHIEAQQKRKPVATQQQKRNQSQKAAKKPVAKKPVGKKQPQQKKPTVSSLKQERAQVQKNIKEQERRLKANEQDVKKRLQNLMVINNEIIDRQRAIDTIRNDITKLDSDIQVLEQQLNTLRHELAERKERFRESMRYLHRNRSVQSKLMFVFSARNFTQMYRRMRFVRDYASYQQTQGEAVLSMQQQVTEAYNELREAKQLKRNLLSKGEQEQRSLEAKQTEQKQVVSSLQREQKTIQGIIDQQRKRDADLNARIDKMIEEEIARAKARAEAEAKRKAAEEARRKAAEEAKRKAAEEARLKAAQNQKRREAEREAARKSQGKNSGKPASRPAKSRETAVVPPPPPRADSRVSSRPTYTATDADRRLTGSFASNKGRLPMPITGSYQVEYRFGSNHMNGGRGHVTLDKKGIGLRCQPGTSVRSVYDGVVTAVFSYDGTWVVIISHGSYLTAYCNMSGVTVNTGQKVAARQAIGKVDSRGVLEFQMRRGSTAFNPEPWLSRR